MQQDKHLLMTIEEVAEALRLSRNTINNWLSRGHLHRVKIGGRIFVAREEVDNFLSKALKH